MIQVNLFHTEEFCVDLSGGVLTVDELTNCLRGTSASIISMWHVELSSLEIGKKS